MALEAAPLSWSLNSNTTWIALLAINFTSPIQENEETIKTWQKFCAGAFIGDGWVITTASCFPPRFSKPHEVTVMTGWGEFDVEQNSMWALHSTAEEIITHPGNKDGSHVDLALVRMREIWFHLPPLEFSAHNHDISTKNATDEDAGKCKLLSFDGRLPRSMRDVKLWTPFAGYVTVKREKCAQKNIPRGAMSLKTVEKLQISEYAEKSVNIIDEERSSGSGDTGCLRNSGDPRRSDCSKDAVQPLNAKQREGRLGYGKNMDYGEISRNVEYDKDAGVVGEPKSRIIREPRNIEYDEKSAGPDGEIWDPKRSIILNTIINARTLKSSMENSEFRSPCSDESTLKDLGNEAKSDGYNKEKGESGCVDELSTCGGKEDIKRKRDGRRAYLGPARKVLNSGKKDISWSLGWRHWMESEYQLKANGLESEVGLGDTGNQDQLEHFICTKRTAEKTEYKAEAGLLICPKKVGGILQCDNQLMGVMTSSRTDEEPNCHQEDNEDVEWPQRFEVLSRHLVWIEKVKRKARVIQQHSGSLGQWRRDLILKQTEHIDKKTLPLLKEYLKDVDPQKSRESAKEVSGTTAIPFYDYRYIFKTIISTIPAIVIVGAMILLFVFFRSQNKLFNKFKLQNPQLFQQSPSVIHE